ncbi:Flp pilus assembly protein CpaB, partial [Phenylobacterium sp.]|uniref:Flp pilus assembly protein CpaB n=1 Tax=Phenylobacterium sp. TaxID=1871053 RepID=UPI002F40BA81
LKVVNYPAESVPAGAFSNVSQLSGTGPAARLALRAIAANEPILPTKVSGPGGKATMSGVLTQGMRAISVRSSDVAGVGGFVLPGDRVDILVTRTVGTGQNPQTVTQALAENVRVMGVDQSDNVDADKPVVAKAVTIEVTPDQAQAISLAQSVGAVTLSLRQVADDTALVRKATTVSDLGRFGAPPAATPARRVARAKAPAGAGMIEVHVTRGTEISGYPIRAN